MDTPRPLGSPLRVHVPQRAAHRPCTPAFERTMRGRNRPMLREDILVRPRCRICVSELHHLSLPSFRVLALPSPRAIRHLCRRYVVTLPDAGAERWAADSTIQLPRAALETAWYYTGSMSWTTLVISWYKPPPPCVVGHHMSVCYLDDADPNCETTPLWLVGAWDGGLLQEQQNCMRHLMSWTC